MKPFANVAVAQAFAGYPPNMRRKLLALRELILETAACTEGVGEIEEALKWGEPAYLTSQSGSGSTVRIAWKGNKPGEYAMYFNCKTSLVETFKTLFPGEFRFEGHRAIVFTESDRIPKDALAFCITAALTYHRAGKAKGPAGTAAASPTTSSTMATKSVQSLVEDIRLVSETNYQIVEAVRALVKKTFKSASEEVKYGGILFSSGVQFCGVFAYREHVSVEFGAGAKIIDDMGFLEGSGKGRRHLKLKAVEEVKSKQLAAYLSLAHKAASGA